MKLIVKLLLITAIFLPTHRAARNFTAASSHNLAISQAVVSATPFTVSAWFKPNNATTFFNIAAITTFGSLNHYWRLSAVGDTAGDPVRFSVKDAGTVQNASTSTGFSANVWNHAVGVAASATSRTVYLNGGSSGTNATSRTPSGVNRTYVGVGPGETDFFDGDIAEIAFWDVALNADEVSALSKGISPLLIRPANLVAYWPLLGRTSPEIDLIGGANLTVTGATASDHPRKIQ